MQPFDLQKNMPAPHNQQDKSKDEGEGGSSPSPTTTTTQVEGESMLSHTPLKKERSRGTVQELINEIDNHLANTVLRSPSPPRASRHASTAGRGTLDRSSSRGTLLVDWDGYGEPVISYRNRREEPPQEQQDDGEEKQESGKNNYRQRWRLRKRKSLRVLRPDPQLSMKTLDYYQREEHTELSTHDGHDSYCDNLRSRKSHLFSPSLSSTTSASHKLSSPSDTDFNIEPLRPSSKDTTSSSNKPLPPLPLSARLRKGKEDVFDFIGEIFGRSRRYRTRQRRRWDWMGRSRSYDEEDGQRKLRKKRPRSEQGYRSKEKERSVRRRLRKNEQMKEFRPYTAKSLPQMRRRWG